MRDVNNLVEQLSVRQKVGLKLILISKRHQWEPRMKTPYIFSRGTGYELSRISDAEITSLLDLIERVEDIRKLVEDRFLGFLRDERRRRLIERCGSDMFVCLKNIYGFDSIDEIILGEYAELSEPLRDIYRTVSAMEAAGVKVHRQLIIRTLGISAQAVGAVLESLTGIITEHTISDKEGLYGWRGRHNVIAETLTRYKYSGQDEIFRLFKLIVDNLNPTYDIEIRTMRDLCDVRSGLGKLRDRSRQNSLLRMMISLAPSERVPRHRLIHNLIDEGDYNQADNEIRIFEKELRRDPPVQRYRVSLLLRKAESQKSILLRIG